ncbi:MAG: hypothetical protein JWM92_521 [Candidatus Nomurabacteria bacterium]|nr:hypothetical protein [Candidatus Nomurabacteria bacterium]
MEPIFFYEHEYYPFSNFSAFMLNWKGYDFMTSEHAYHYEKFPDYPEIQEKIKNARSAHDAKKIARQYELSQRADWHEVKVAIMKEILREKATQHPYVRKKLIDSGNRPLIENSWQDSFWGWGKNKDGRNQLGKLWMEVRDESRRVLIAFGKDIDHLKCWAADHAHVAIGMRTSERSLVFSNPGKAVCVLVFFEQIKDEPPIVQGLYVNHHYRGGDSLKEILASPQIETIQERSWCADRDEKTNNLIFPSNIIDHIGKQWEIHAIFD